MYNINISYVIMQTTIVTSEALFITDTYILIKMWGILFVEKYKIIVKKLQCSVREIKASNVYLLEA